MTVNVCPAIVRTPVRPVFPERGATLNLTVPFPVSLAPEEIVNHAAPLVAVHAQPLAADTLTSPSPPLRSNVAEVGLIE